MIKVTANLLKHSNGGYFADCYGEHGELLCETKVYSDLDDLKIHIKRKYPQESRKRQIAFEDLTGEVLPDEESDQVTTEKKQKMKRKPFTPYGLNGYLVDKQGNIRLMLDRRANAQTITLPPDMFKALADMVKRSQEQL